MKSSCSIIIYNYESLEFLRACVRQIRRYLHPDIEQHIIISDQSINPNSRNSVIAEFGGSPDITIVPMKNLFSGYAIDYIMRFVDIKTEYVCTFDVDAFPIHKNWLYMCITLIQENNFSFVGGMAFESRATDTIYPPVKFYSMAPFFCVGRTADWREMALQGGFTRFHERPKIDVPMAFGNHEWADWAKDDYINRGSDDCVPAWCWAGKYREHNMLSLGITHIMGVPGEESGYGRIMEDIVFHFVFCYTSIGLEKEMGEKYCKWKQRIHDCYDDALIEEMLAFARANPYNTGTPEAVREIWDGKLKKSLPASEELHKRIRELKDL